MNWITIQAHTGKSPVTDGPLHVRELQWMILSQRPALSHRGQVTFLDSAARHELLGRYSYVACDPFSTYTIVGGRASCDGVALWGIHGMLFALFSPRIGKNIAPIFALPAGRSRLFGLPSEHDVGTIACAGDSLPGSAPILHFYDLVVSFDHRDSRCWIGSTGWPEQDPARRSERAHRRADEFAALLASPSSAPKRSIGFAGAWHSNFSRERTLPR
ncbi:hypothetical protein [Bradyrhizobium sp. SSUT77]|uniref:hypothetical protein n=1 Tax=Bradyrhizobium sp. SSUT77 TaxID=3040603 RepID=UPI002447D029|nr:hypothetical protein [Bradyrhizobium sp. SSUT77]MDH2348180.1 hypothetical protein [Bradyrhizobium sp. SSUT77]